MDKEQLLGRYERLRRELAAAYAEPVGGVSRGGRIDRLVDDLSNAERLLLRHGVDGLGSVRGTAATAGHRGNAASAGQHAAN